MCVYMYVSVYVYVAAYIFQIALSMYIASHVLFAQCDRDSFHWDLICVPYPYILEGPMGKNRN